MMQVLLGRSDVAGWGAFLKVGIFSLALKKACAVFSSGVSIYYQVSVKLAQCWTLFLVVSIQS
jgi:hypothetical protein